MVAVTWENLQENTAKQGPFRVTHQGFRHDDADLAFREQREVGKQALQDKLARFTLGVHVDGGHDDGTFLLSRGSTDRWDGWL